MKKLAKLVKELDHDISICVKCGTCLGACPLYKVNLIEGNVARGKIALIDGLIKNLFSNPDELSKIINQCLLCGSCAASCPSNVDTMQIFFKIRIILSEFSRFSYFKKIIFKKIIAKPQRFDKLFSLLEKFQFLFIKPRKNIQLTSSFRFIPQRISQRRFKCIAQIPFHKTEYIGNTCTDNNPPFKIAFFPGCAIDKIYPNIAIDAIQVLKYFKIDIFIPNNIGCCGIPVLASGDKTSFIDLIDHNIDIFSLQKFDYLITPCATCLSTIKHLWIDFYQTRDKERKEYLIDLSSKALDISQFLINILKIPDFPGNNSLESITYHDPCHHCKVLNIRTEPRSLIKASGKKIIEMDQSDLCCGMGGTFNLFNYKDSIKIGQLKGKNIINTGCKTLATSCPACMMQISDILDKQKTDIAIKHPIEIYKDFLFKN